MSHEVKLCPECGEEYTLTARECADCRIALVLPGELAAAPGPQGFPPISELECVRVGPLPWTRALSEALETAEIAHRVERDTRKVEEGGVDPRRFGGEDVFGTWVRPVDLQAAREIDQALFGHLEPGESLAAGGQDRCPACEEPLGDQTLECPGCGLHLG